MKRSYIGWLVIFVVLCFAGGLYWFVSRTSKKETAQQIPYKHVLFIAKRPSHLVRTQFPFLIGGTKHALWLIGNKDDEETKNNIWQHTHTSLVEDVTDYEQVAQAIDNLAYKGLKKENMHYVFASHDPTMCALAAKIREKYAVKHGLYPEQLASFAMKYDERVKKEEDVPKLNYQQGDCYQLDAVIQGNNIVRYSVQRIEEKFLQEESKKIAYRRTIDVKDQALTSYLKKQTEAYIKAWHYDEGGLLLVFTFTKKGLFLSKKEPFSSRFARMHHRLSLKFPLPKQDNNIRGSIIFTTPETATQDEQGNVGYETGSNLAMKKKWKTFNYLGKIRHGYEEPKASAKGSLKLKEHVVYNFSSKHRDAVIKDMQNINLADYPFKHDGEVEQSYRPLIKKCLMIVAFYSIARILLWLKEKPSKDA